MKPVGATLRLDPPFACCCQLSSEFVVFLVAGFLWLLM